MKQHSQHKSQQYVPTPLRTTPSAEMLVNFRMLIQTVICNLSYQTRWIIPTHPSQLQRQANMIFLKEKYSRQNRLLMISWSRWRVQATRLPKSMAINYSRLSSVNSDAGSKFNWPISTSTRSQIIKTYNLTSKIWKIKFLSEYGDILNLKIKIQGSYKRCLLNWTTRCLRNSINKPTTNTWV